VYSVEGLQAGIENCRRNIQVFEDAIRKEKETIQQYNFYISEIVRKEKEQRLAEAKKKAREEQVTEGE
jgi:hypothetical protein